MEEARNADGECRGDRGAIVRHQPSPEDMFTWRERGSSPGSGPPLSPSRLCSQWRNEEACAARDGETHVPVTVAGPRRFCTGFRVPRSQSIVRRSYTTHSSRASVSKLRQWDSFEQTTDDMHCGRVPHTRECRRELWNQGDELTVIATKGVS